MTPQRKALTLVIFWCVVASVAFVMPFGYGEEEASAAGESPAAEPTPYPSATKATPASPSPEPSETVIPTPTPEPEPTPSPVGPEPTEEGRRKRSAPTLIATPTTSIGADPSQIEIGETTTITASLTNSGDTAASEARLTLSVPNELEPIATSPEEDFVDIDPGGNTTLVWEFGSLGVGVTKTVVLTAMGEDAGSPVTVEAEGRLDGTSSFEQTDITVTEPEVPTVKISDPHGPTFAQVGEQVRYGLTISNAGDTPATDLAIVYLVPAEIHVERAGLPKGVDAVQIGIFKGKEDVVWAIDKLGPGKKVSVDWLGTVTRGGDLAARAAARAEADGTVVDRSGSSTYLANELGTGTQNPDFEPIVRRVVTRETVTVTPPSERAPTDAGVAGGSAELPFTGGTPRGIVLIAIGFLIAGAVLVVVTSRRLRGRRMIVGCMALLVLATACIGTEETPPDRVKGETITRDGGGGDDGNQPPEDGTADEGNDGILDDPAVDPGNEGPNADGRPGDGSADPLTDPDDDGSVAGPPVIPVPPAPESRVVRRVTTRTMDEDDLAIESAASITAPAATVSRSGGGRSSARAGGALLSSDVDVENGRLLATVELVNASNRRRLQVGGDLLFKIEGFGTLRTGGVDRVLNPDGEISAQFEFQLPAGSFSSQPSFSAS